MRNIELSHISEPQEKEPAFRLETDVIFMRHGVAEKLEGADEASVVDAQRRHTPQGEQQTYQGGIRAAKELGFNKLDNILIVSRSSPRVRARQTVEKGLEGFLEELNNEGILSENILNQQSVNPSRKNFDYGNHTAVYSAGAVRRGSTKGLSEEWARNPELLQLDSDQGAEGALADDPEANLNAESVLTKMENSYRQTMAVADRAASLLAVKWQKNQEHTSTENPPRLVIFEGAHGFVTEPWLKEVVKDYEQITGQTVNLELGYGEFWRVHWPSDPKQEPTLLIDGKIIPVKQEYLSKINSNQNEE